MSDINKVMLIGRAVRDPELKYTQGGTSVCSFSVANEKTWKDNGEKKQKTSFFNCVAWAKTGETIVQYVKKGHRIAIVGRLQQRSWDDQNGNKRSVVEIVVEEFQFLQGKSESAPVESETDPKEGEYIPPTQGDDEIPF